MGSEERATYAKGSEAAEWRNGMRRLELLR